MDACAKAVIEQTQEIETQRLLLSCRIKECEHRISLQTEGKVKLCQALQKKEDEERAIAKSLEKLSATQDHLKRQILSQADSLHKCEVEEALLLKNAEEGLKAEELELQACHTKMKELEAVKAMFQTPDIVLTVRNEMETLQQRREAINQEQRTLLEDIASTERSMQALRMPLGSAASDAPTASPRAGEAALPASHTQGISFAAPDDSADAEEINLLQAQVAQKEAELERLTSNVPTRHVAVQREVADLSKRSAELHNWIEHAKRAMEEVHARQTAVETAKSEQLCFHCLDAARA